MRLWHVIAISAIWIGGIYWLFNRTHASPGYPPGVLAPDPPVQQAVQQARVWVKNGYRIIPLARFSLYALVLHKRRYRFDRESEISPIDLALGWGPMADQQVLDHIDISQANRWYYWHADSLPIPRKQIIASSANMHMIPANDAVRMQLADVKRGDLIALSGYLVQVQAGANWTWRSSLTRTDTGEGACELVWVENLAIHQPQSKKRPAP